MVSSAELQLMNDNSQPENDKDASGGDSPKVSPVTLSGYNLMCSTSHHCRRIHTNKLDLKIKYVTCLH